MTDRPPNNSFSRRVFENGETVFVSYIDQPHKHYEATVEGTLGALYRVRCLRNDETYVVEASRVSSPWYDNNKESPR